MKAHIDVDPLSQSVKVWLFRDEPGGRVFMWPSGYEGQCVIYTQEIVPHEQALPDTIRPFLEMGHTIWSAFTKALLAEDEEHRSLDALDIVAKTLEREQNRVDALIHALIKNLEGDPPLLMMQATGGPIDDPDL